MERRSIERRNPRRPSNGAAKAAPLFTAPAFLTVPLPPALGLVAVAGGVALLVAGMRKHA